MDTDRLDVSDRRIRCSAGTGSACAADMIAVWKALMARGPGFVLVRGGEVVLELDAFGSGSEAVATLAAAGRLRGVPIAETVAACAGVSFSQGSIEELRKLHIHFLMVPVHALNPFPEDVWEYCVKSRYTVCLVPPESSSGGPSPSRVQPARR